MIKLTVKLQKLLSNTWKYRYSLQLNYKVFLFQKRPLGEHTYLDPYDTISLHPES